MKRRIRPRAWHRRTWLFLAGLFALACAASRPTISQSAARHEGWEIVHPGGDTICARGGRYAFLVCRGTVNKLVVDFQGGGACWDERTCSVDGALFVDAVDPERLRAVLRSGIYDRHDKRNPLRDWHHVVIPYCTGDVHWGNSVVSYGSPSDKLAIRHKGAANARAVLDWTYREFSAPETILVTGCSAGSYGSIGWAPHVMEHYKSAKVYQLGDSGAGVATESFVREHLPSWNIAEVLPRWIPGLERLRSRLSERDLPYIYGQIGRHYPSSIVAQFNTVRDTEQVFYYSTMGGSGGATEWSRQMLASLERAQRETPNFRSYVAPGERHCVLPFDGFYTLEVEGVRLRDWLADMVGGRPVPDLRCEGRCR